MAADPTDLVSLLGRFLYCNSDLCRQAARCYSSPIDLLIQNTFSKSGAAREGGFHRFVNTVFKGLTPQFLVPKPSLAPTGGSVLFIIRDFIRAQHVHENKLEVMKGNLRISIGCDSSNDCELFVRFQNGAFSGEGSAWFNVAEIEAFAISLSAYPLRGSVKLQGGFWHSAERRIEHEHVFVAVYPIDLVGHIGVKVRAASPVHTHERPDQRHSAEIELRTEYEQLRHFSSSLLEVIRGARAEALIESNDF